MVSLSVMESCMIRQLWVLFVALRVALPIKDLKQETVLVTGNYTCGVFNSSLPIRLTCGEVTVSGSHTKPPRVDWYVKVNSTSETGDNELTFLNAAQYWRQINQLHMCMYGLSYSRHRGSSGHDCSKRKSFKDFSALYSCDYTYSHVVQPMQYRCTISTYQANNNYKIIKVKDITVKAINPSSKCNLQPACYMPAVNNMTAVLLGNGSIKAVWSHSPRPSYMQCTRPYCNGSRRFEVQFQMFDSVDSLTKRPLFKTTWLRTAKRRETFLVLNNTIINSNIYYQYRLRNRNQSPHYASDPDNHGRRVKTTKPVYCHFNRQQAAVLEEPSRSRVLNVTYESFVNITCQAKGHPLPRVKLMYESQDGQNVTMKEGVSQIYTIHYNYRRLQRIFYCQSENTIIHPFPCGTLHHSVQEEKITINVV